MKAKVHPLRVLVKAIVLFVVINIMFAMTNPPIGKITLFNYLFPGRLRFPYEQEPNLYFLGFNAPVYDDFDAMFGAHVISKGKSVNEFRMILLGDSATWGVSVLSDETLSEQINDLNLQTCDGRSVHAYNLGYPLSSVTRDFLILDKAMDYQPDMILWLITLTTLEPKTAESNFILPHSERYLQLVDAYDLSIPQLAKWQIKKLTFYDRTILGQRKHIKNVIFSQALGLLWAATGIDNHLGRELQTGNPPNPDVENDLAYDGQLPEKPLVLPNPLLLDVLSAGYKMAGDIPVVLVNQPLFVANGKNSNVRYNDIYPRWVYDEYRQFMFMWSEKNKRIFWDYWNVLPPNNFSDTHFHRNPIGEMRFAQILAPKIQTLICQ